MSKTMFDIFWIQKKFQLICSRTIDLLTTKDNLMVFWMHSKALTMAMITLKSVMTRFGTLEHLNTAF